MMSLLPCRVLAAMLAAGLTAAAASPASAATETVLHAFQGGSDGANPFAGLVKWHGALYGTTQIGGSTNNGTVFSVTPAGVETVLYSFKGGSDGAGSVAGLINVGGTFYGTTYSGGGTGCTGRGAVGCGTVFSVTPTGVERVVYAFKGGNDGYYPNTDLMDDGGTLYGTAAFGGSSSGGGAVFSVTTAGAETVLHTFGPGANHGSSPSGGLVELNGRLYGTTQLGGTADKGTVFSLTQAGGYRVVYSF